MPELPEVEATVQYLGERIEGLRILSIDVLWAKTIATGSLSQFREQLIGALVTRTFRRGKFVGVELFGETKLFLFVHLRMSGSLDVIASSNEVDRHDRVVISFEGGKSLRFNDTRKFGRMYLYPDMDTISEKLGIEPLSEEFTHTFLGRLLGNRKNQIKSLLLNQKLIAGLGNIYVDECLWKARIHPTISSNRISKKKVIELHRAIKETLTEAVSLLGTDFGDGVVYGGMYTPQVYGRTGEPCQRCGAVLKRTVVGQRGTHFCPRCQIPLRPSSFGKLR